MQSAITTTPTLWAVTPNDASVMVYLNTLGDRLDVVAFHASSGASYKTTLSHSDLTKAMTEAGETDPSTFLSHAANAFLKNAVLLTPSGESCILSWDNVKIPVPGTAEDTQALIIARMLKIHQMHCHPSDAEGKISSLRSQEKAAREQKINLQTEHESLRDNLNRNRQKTEQSKKRLEDLKMELKKVKGNQSSDPWEEIRKKQLETRNSRLPNPLRNKTCKDFDVTLLRLIKSKFLKPEECAASSPANKVVMPFTASELAKETSRFRSSANETIWKSLDLIDDWNYRVFDVQTALNGDTYESLPFQPHGGSLFVTFYALVNKYKFAQKFNIDEQVLLNWISMVEGGYHGNPYHNSMHAADVLQITHFIMSKGGLIERCKLTDEMVFAALLAASIHDFDHPGINNNFHMKTGSHLATLYNDRSVLENLHVSSIFELMKDDVYNILSSFSDAQRQNIREVMIELVLATDMGMHGKYLNTAKAKIQERADFTNREEQILGLGLALKMADISNCGRSNEIYLEWSSKISDEFYQQGDRERNLGLPCSPFMDRMQPALAKSQIAFINYIITPFFEQVSELLPAMRFAVELAEGNKRYWAEHDDS